MPLSTSCPNCQALFRLPDDTVGRKVQCQKCATVFVVPLSDGATTTPGISVPSEVPMAPPVNEPAAAKTNPLPPPLPETVTVSSAASFADPDAKPSARKRTADPEETPDTDPDRVKPKPKRRDPPAKSNSALTAVMVVLIAGGLFSCIACAAGVGYWQFVDQRPKAMAKKKDRMKDGRKDFAVKDMVKRDDMAFKDMVKRDDMGFKHIDKKIDFGINEIPPNLIRDGFNKRGVDLPPPAGGIPLIWSKEGTATSNLALQADDPFNFDGRRHKQYTIQLTAGKVYQFDMISQQFDAHLYLIDDANFVLAADDDGGGNLNSRFWIRAPATGEFRVHAAAHSMIMGKGLGDYTVVVKQVN